jgi:4-amino-4-deoxy-L-arabinose transferase-like glycosyltransferase
MSDTRRALLLILVASAVRLGFAASTGLGIDESYMVGAGRQLQLSYFDHPPLAWWLAWGAARLLHSEAAWVVRLPFIALFALTTWTMERLTARLCSPRAGLWAAAALTLSPVLGVTTASWVLPDGPLVAALLGAVFCFTHALEAPRGWRWWLATGLCLGLALLSKYSAILTAAGAVLYLVTQPQDRRWLARPQPYAAALLALLIFSPVLLWNMRHGWVSIAFQGGRAAAARLHPLAPLTTLAGEALFLLPWIWFGLIWVGIGALRRGPREKTGWLLACLACLPIGLFALVSLWSRQRVLFHWADPGYLMLYPLLGAALADMRGRWPRRALLGSTVLILLGLGAVVSDLRLDWLAALPGVRGDPALEALDWTSVRQDLARRGLLRADLPVAALRWSIAGKLAYALGTAAPVFCLGDDPREFAYQAPAGRFAGQDILIVAPQTTLAQLTRRYGAAFGGLEALPPASLRHAGHAVLTVPLFLGHALRPGVADLPG